MDSTDLVDLAMNSRNPHARILFAVRHLRHTMDQVAKDAAKSNAEWHDDPKADDHAAFHAPAEQQYPQKMRDDAILELVRHYLFEESLSGKQV